MAKGAFSCGVTIFVWVLLNSDVLVVIEMGAYIHGVYFLWVPFLLILRYVVCFGVHAKFKSAKILNAW